jgi:opacity protein-like surface antigen
MLRTRCAVILTGIVLGLAPATRAFAQPASDPPGPYIIDAHVTFATYPPTDADAAALGLEKAQLPKRGLGFDFGVHVYPVRKGFFALGIGANYVSTNGTDQTIATTSTEPDLELAQKNAPKMKTHFSAMTPTLSLNFGSKRGWSYLSAGLGTSQRSIEQTDGVPLVADVADKTKSSVLTYGGGARWFMSQHVAFGFDLRWYKAKLKEASSTTRAFPAQTIFVAGAGLSIR